jgi:hypothetical protein
LRKNVNKLPEEVIEHIPERRIRAADYAADLETIRINRWHMFDAHEKKVGSLDTTTQNIDHDMLQSGWVYVVTNITALETGTKPTTISIGYVRGATYHILTKQTPANNNDSVEYVGQVILREHDKVRACFKGATEGDTAEVFINGYQIRR